jgi:hypothetical protein
MDRYVGIRTTFKPEQKTEQLSGNISGALVTMVRRSAAKNEESGLASSELTHSSP